jgi:hypothetical protein
MTYAANLAEEYAATKAEIEGLTRRLEELKIKIKETGMAELVGPRNIVTVTLSEPTRFDATAAKTFLTPEQIAACTKTGELVTSIRVKAVKNVKVLA